MTTTLTFFPAPGVISGHRRNMMNFSRALAEIEHVWSVMLQTALGMHIASRVPEDLDTEVRILVGTPDESITLINFAKDDRKIHDPHTSMIIHIDGALINRPSVVSLLLDMICETLESEGVNRVLGEQAVLKEVRVIATRIPTMQGQTRAFKRMEVPAAL